jgi:hypothetical protein
MTDDTGAPASVVCKGCGLEAAPGAQRCRCGCVLLGSKLARQLARTTGIYAVHQPADLRQSIDDFMAEIVVDRGGEAELSTIEKAYISKLGHVEITLRLLAADIAARGLVTPAGGVRSVYGPFLQGIDRWDKLAQRIGVKRQAHNVTFDAQLRERLAGSEKDHQ